MTDIHGDKILILDFGAQYTQLIARRIREAGVYCEIWAWDDKPADIAAFNPKGIILSGGPNSVYEASEWRAPQVVFELGVPVLGICYGMQTMAMQFGGSVESGHHREFGAALVNVDAPCALLDGLNDGVVGKSPRGCPEPAHLNVWMSHGDRVTAVPSGFTVTASTDSVPIVAMADESRRYYGVQFHPESIATEHGHAMLANFMRIAGLTVRERG